MMDACCAAQEQNIWMCCTRNETWANHTPPDNPLFKVKAPHRNSEKMGSREGLLLCLETI